MKQLWLNLPVKDVNKSRAFFTQIGCQLNTHGNTETSASITIGGSTVMLYDEKAFKSFVNNEISDPTKSTEVLISFDVASKEDADDIAKKVLLAGGRTGHQPKEMDGWLYGFVFSDLDGHRWNVVYMDMSKMPKN